MMRNITDHKHRLHRLATTCALSILSTSILNMGALSMGTLSLILGTTNALAQSSSDSRSIASTSSGSLQVITAQGQQLLDFLDRSQVETLWQAGVHVDWESGIADGKPLKGNGKHTHCSAFAAAMAKRLGVYLLRPPEHSATLLANAQFDWLTTHALTLEPQALELTLQAHSDNWFKLADASVAQKLANQGQLVVAVYRNHHDDRPGHIAIVRPTAKSTKQISEEGPQITQAGGHNYFSTTVKQGFASHPAAWNKQELQYFAHALKW